MALELFCVEIVFFKWGVNLATFEDQLKRIIYYDPNKPFVIVVILYSQPPLLFTTWPNHMEHC